MFAKTYKNILAFFEMYYEINYEMKNKMNYKEKNLNE